MTRISIRQEVATFNGADKRYDLLYKQTGMELGYGRAGTYEGHSHLCFVDVLFSPDGIQWSTDAGPVRATLVVVPPRTYLPAVTTGDFVFLKFCPDDREVILPDKVSEELHEQRVLTYKDHAHVELPWYRSAGDEAARIEILLRGNELTLAFSGQPSMTFGP